MPRSIVMLVAVALAACNKLTTTASFDAAATRRAIHRDLPGSSSATIEQQVAAVRHACGLDLRALELYMGDVIDNNETMLLRWLSAGCREKTRTALAHPRTSTKP